MNKKNIILFALYAVLANLLVLVGGWLDAKLQLSFLFTTIMEVVVAVGGLLWLTWYGTRPREVKGFMPYAWLGLIPVALYALACFGPFDSTKIFVDFVIGGVTTLTGALWQVLCFLGLGGSLLSREGRLYPMARGIWIASFALPSLFSIILAPAGYASALLGAMVAVAMGAFLTVVYEHTGKLWVPILLFFSYYVVGEVFTIGSNHFAYLGGATYYCILIVNIMLYSVGAVYLYRHAKRD